MALFVYNTATGALVSWCPNDSDPVASGTVLAANGLASVSGLPALDATHVWDAASKTVITVASSAPNWIATYQFILLFTTAEHAAIAASSDQKVQQLMMAISVAQQI